MELAVDPGVDLPLNHVHEFLFGRLGMRIRGARARRHPHQVNPDAEQSGSAANRPRWRHVLVTIRVAVGLLWDVGGRDNKGR
jgi:hypothetical protein